MSHSADETYSVYKETLRASRKERNCDACGMRVPKSGQYWHVAMIFQGEFETVKRCLACQATHVHLRELAVHRDMWPDERLNCGLDYEEEWGKLPSHIASLAFWSYGQPLPATNPCTTDWSIQNHPQYGTRPLCRNRPNCRTRNSGSCKGPKC